MSTFTSVPTVDILDAYRFRIAKPFVYYLGELDSDEIVSVPAGMITDLASVPRALWWWLPPHGRYAKAAIIHDALYHGHPIIHQDALRYPTRKQADAIFLEAMRVLGVGRIRSWLMWVFVRAFGWRAWRGKA